jgi:hypothetical protein
MSNSSLLRPRPKALRPQDQHVLIVVTVLMLARFREYGINFISLSPTTKLIIHPAFFLQIDWIVNPRRAVCREIRLGLGLRVRVCVP